MFYSSQCHKIRYFSGDLKIYKAKLIQGSRDVLNHFMVAPSIKKKLN